MTARTSLGAVVVLAAFSGCNFGSSGSRSEDRSDSGSRATAAFHQPFTDPFAEDTTAVAEEPRVFAELLAGRDRAFLYPEVYGNPTPEEFAGQVETRVRLIKFPFVLTNALRNPEVAKLEVIRREENPVDWLSDALRVAVLMRPNSAFIRIGISDSVPGEQATPIVNAVVAGFMQEVVDQEMIEEDRRTEELKTHLAIEKAELDRLRRELRNLQKAIHAAKTEQAATVDSVSARLAALLRERLAEHHYQLLVAEVNLELLMQKENDVAKESASHADESIIADRAARLAELLKEIAQQKAITTRIQAELNAARIKNDDFSTRWVDETLKQEEVDRLTTKVRDLEDLVDKREIERRHASRSSWIEVKREAVAR